MPRMTQLPNRVSEEGWRSLITDVIAIAGGLSAVIAVGYGALQVRDLADTSKRANMTQRMSALKGTRDFLQKDEDKRRQAEEFLRDGKDRALRELDAKIKQYKSGQAYYLSAELNKFAEVQNHYEQLGAMVKLRYIDFPLVFEIIAFPDSYMEEVEPLRLALAKRWKGLEGEGKELPDLGDNIAYLKAAYEHCRKHSSASPSALAAAERAKTRERWAFVRQAAQWTQENILRQAVAQDRPAPPKARTYETMWNEYLARPERLPSCEPSD